MRLIDADKIVYSWQQDRNGKFHDGVTLESIINNIPTENINDLITKELEKIKDKMMDDGAYFQEVEGHTDFIKGISHCIDIIDAEISELKGDN